MDTLPVCPYCGMPLAKTTQRKTKCPHCKQPIFVKKSPDNPVKRMMTEHEAQLVEQQWAIYQHAQHCMREFGCTSDSYLNLLLQMESAHGLDDAPWKVEEFLLKGQFQSLKSHHDRAYAAWRLATLYNSHAGNFRPYLSVFSRETLLNFQVCNYVKKVEIKQADWGDICPVCQIGNGQQFSLAEAVNALPLPHVGCTCSHVNGAPGFCRCQFWPVLKF